MPRWHAITDRTGQRFGKLTVVKMDRTGRKTFWRCTCDCGGERVCRADHLISGAYHGCVTCGAAHKSQRSTKHGDAADYSMTLLYRVWISMRQRCSNDNDKAFRYYGARGIAVCEEWQDFEIFKAWALATGYEQGLTIERMDPTEGYCPANCEWITRAENSHRVHHPKIKKAA